jgi:hypothetical protein
VVKLIEKVRYSCAPFQIFIYTIDSVLVVFRFLYLILSFQASYFSNGLLTQQHLFFLFVWLHREGSHCSVFTYFNNSV